MCEEYLTSKEIMQKIEELKIRLAFQQEFEQEVDELLAKADSPNAGQALQILEMEEKTLRNIAAHTGRQNQLRTPQLRFHRNLRIAAAIVLLAAVSIGSAMATVHMVQIGLLKLEIETYPEYTVYGLVPSADTVEVPQDWNGNFYPTYIPNGYKFDRCYHSFVMYYDEAGNYLSFSEETYGSRTNLDTENASLSTVLINGAEATLIEKDRWTAVVWSANNRLFIVDMDGEKDEALKIAASVIMVR